MSREAVIREQERRRKWFLLLLLLLIIVVFCLYKFSDNIFGKIGMDPADIPYFDVIHFQDGPSGKILGESKQLNVFNSEMHDGKKIIYPGATGEYEFILYNVTSNAIGVSLSFSDENPNRVPLRYKIKVEETFYFGSSTKWYTMEDIAKMPPIFCTIANNSSLRVTLVWEWVQEDDEHDTLIGIISAAGRAEYLLSIKAVAETYSA